MIAVAVDDGQHKHGHQVQRYIDNALRGHMRHAHAGNGNHCSRKKQHLNRLIQVAELGIIKAVFLVAVHYLSHSSPAHDMMR